MMPCLFSLACLYLLIASNKASYIPSSGFVKLYFQSENRVSVNGETTLAEQRSMIVKIISKSSIPKSCNTVQFLNLPKPNYSPLAGPNSFEILDEQYNNKPAWSNGREYLSFVSPREGDHGTWIIGVEPGVDNGYVFIKPESGDLVAPITSDNSGAIWYWLQKGNWQEQKALKVVCLDADEDTSENLAPQSRMFNIEYFDPTSTNPHESDLVLNPTNSIANLLESKSASFDSITTPLHLIKGLFLDVEQDRWLEIEAFEPIAAVGCPSKIFIEDKGPPNRASIGHLINDEHAGLGSWRLTFLRDGTISSSLSAPNDRLMIIVNGNTGPTVGYTIQPFGNTIDIEKKYTEAMLHRLGSVSKGEYLWLWFSTTQSNLEIHDQLFLECVGVTNEKAIFKYAVSDRREVMEQTVLSKDTNYVTMLFDSSNNTPVFEFQGSDIILHGGFNLGSNALGYIKNYLLSMEGVLGDMSSCYFYHAAVTLPKALVYAAEIMCVLMGAKPLTLIQYTTPNDHQWKHPLVRELSTAIVKSKLLLGDQLDVEFRIAKYSRDETLVFYRKSREYIYESLLPQHQAQALHPAPYPDSKNPRPDEEKQIFYAWWNGFVLGYPEHFIDSYCRSFHNGLTEDERDQQSIVAKKDVKEYFTKLSIQNPSQKVVQIKMGLDPEISEQAWNTILSYI